MKKEEIITKLENIIYDDIGTIGSYSNSQRETSDIILIELVYYNKYNNKLEDVNLNFEKQKFKEITNDGNYYYEDIVVDNIIVKHIIKQRNYYRDNFSKYYVNFDIYEEFEQDIYSKYILQKYYLNKVKEYIEPIVVCENDGSSHKIILNNDFIEDIVENKEVNLGFICLYDSVDEGIREFVGFDLDVSKIKAEDYKIKNDNYKVLNLEKLKIEDINQTNYNDDMRLATCYFDFKALEVLKKYINIYGISAVYKRKNTIYDGFQIDIIDNKYIGIAEGTFNAKVIETLKQELFQYNVKEKFSPPYMSKAIYQNHIEGKWLENVDYTVEQLIGELLFNKYGNTLVEKDIFGYYTGKDYDEFKSDMKKIFPMNEVEGILSFEELQKYVLKELQ